MLSERVEEGLRVEGGEGHECCRNGNGGTHSISLPLM